MRKTILDTDILSEVFKEQNTHVTAQANAYLVKHDRLSFTSVSASEFLYGFYAKDAKAQLRLAQTFLKANEEFEPDSNDYWLAAEINGALKRRGKPIGTADTLIASFAINRSLPLATGNARHYQFVIEAGFELIIENWKTSSPKSD